MSLVEAVLGGQGHRTAIAGALLAIGRRIGLTPYNWRLIRSLRRPRWLYATNGRIPPVPQVARAPTDVTDADLALCRRLLNAYDTALDGRREDPQTSGIWSWIYETRQRRLIDVLARGDARELAVELASMFRRDFVVGLAPGALKRHGQSRLGARIWRLKALDELVSLAEAVGVVPVEGHEQGRIGVGFEDGLRSLVERVEASLGVSIDFPQVGAAYGLSVHDRLITLDSPEQIYTAMRLKHALRLHLGSDAPAGPKVVEIGGGYGATCYWFVKHHGAVARYTVVDLPVVNVLQGYFLSRALGHSSVSLYGEEPAQVAVVPSSALASVDAPHDLLVNKDSMPEMPEVAVLGYLRWARSTCQGIFYSSNQESKAPFQGEPQGVVADAIARVGGFSRLRRDHSWVRPGYVEEIYAVTDGAR